MRNVFKSDRIGWIEENALKSAPTDPSVSSDFIDGKANASIISQQPLVHVLYAEDNTDDSLILKVKVKQSALPIQLKIVPDGSLAIEYLLCRGAYRDRHPSDDPRVVITDLRMRGQDPLKLIEFIRTYPQFKCLPIIVYSGCEYAPEINAAIEAGATAYIRKTADNGELLVFLDRLVRHLANPHGDCLDTIVQQLSRQPS
jgi:CheY-like chemotaxis protein